MSIKIGIYEFFAYTIPGILYVCLLGYVLSAVGIMEFDLQALHDLPLIFYILIMVFAYVVGLLIDPIAKKLWYQFFRPKDKSNKNLVETVDVVYSEFLIKCKVKSLNLHPRNWYSILVRLHQDNPEIASSLERFNASRIMLRNTSFALVIFAIIQIAFFIQSSNHIEFIILFFVAIIFSIIAGKESAKYHRWFYAGIFQAAVAYSLDITKLVTFEDKENA